MYNTVIGKNDVAPKRHCGFSDMRRRRESVAVCWSVRLIIEYFKINYLQY